MIASYPDVMALSAKPSQVTRSIPSKFANDTAVRAVTLPTSRFRTFITDIRSVTAVRLLVA